MTKASSATDLAELVVLSRELGRPSRRLAILAEGNTSLRVSEDVLAVKASGRSLRHASESDFVLVSLSRLAGLLEDPIAGDPEVAAYFDEVHAEQGARPSVETLLHVVCMLDLDASSVAHTHPESVAPFLCSDQAPLLAATVLFPDQVVVMGPRGLLVPYADPGIVLAREVRRLVAEHLRDWGRPRVLYLGNHGIVAMGDSPAQALQVTEMVDKVSRVLSTALSIGSLRPMDESDVRRIDGRPDEQIRRAELAAVGMRPALVDEEA